MEASALSGTGLRVRIACVGSRDQRISQNLRTYSIAPPLKGNLHYGLFPAFHRLRYLEITKRFRPKLVHYHLVMSTFFRPDYRAPAVLDVHDVFFLREEFYKRSLAPPPLFASLLDKMEFALTKGFDGVIATSPSMANFIRRYFRGQISVVPNAVDVSNLRPGNDSNRPSERFVVGSLGQTSKHLGFYEFASAVAMLAHELKELRAVWVGSVTQEAVRFVKRLGIEHVFSLPGFLPDELLGSQLATFDLGLSVRQRSTPKPELSDYYQGTKTLALMACGVPVVVTPLMEQERLVDVSGGGFASSGFGSDAISDAILRAYDSRQSLPGLGRSGRRYVETNHSAQSLTRALLGAYRNLVPSLGHEEPPDR